MTAAENLDLHVATDATAQLLEVLNSGVPIDDNLRGLLERLARMHAERDRVMEDFLNRHVVRRTESVSLLGTGGVAGGLAYTPVLPVTSLVLAKANPLSRLMVQADIGGIFQELGALPSYLSFAIQVFDMDGNAVGTPTEIGRNKFAINGADIQLSYQFFLVGLDAGTYTFQLYVAGSKATTAFTSEVNTTIQLLVTEVP